MKLSLAASALLLVAKHQSTVQAECDSEFTINVPAGVKGLTFAGYAVDDSKIVRSIGTANQVIIKNFTRHPTYTIDEATGVKVTAGDSCSSSESDDTVKGSTSAAVAFVGGLLTGSPFIAATSLLFASMPCAFAEEEQGCFFDEIEVEIVTTPTAKPPSGTNPCDGAAIDIAKQACIVDSVVKVLGQSGADVTVGYTGGLNTTWDPITTPLYQAGLCPVNVHWHLGAEHRSEGEYDETFDANGPETESSEGHRRTSGRMGFRCKHYDASDSKFTTPYSWQHCKDLHVGETYEVHWPHSTAGACGTVNQWQTPFYDGVFCNLDAETLGTLAPPPKTTMKIYKCIFSGDEMCSDSYPMEECYEGMILKFKGKSIVKTEGDYDIGANPSQDPEGGPQESYEKSSVTVINVVDAHQLCETGFDKKGYMSFIKGYMQRLKAHLEEKNPDRVALFTKGAQAFVKDEILAKFDDWQFFLGSSMDASAAIALMKYEEDGTTPTFYLFKDGLEMMKV